MYLGYLDVWLFSLSYGNSGHLRRQVGHYQRYTTSNRGEDRGRDGSYGYYHHLKSYCMVSKCSSCYTIGSTMLITSVGSATYAFLCYNKSSSLPDGESSCHRELIRTLVSLIMDQY